MDQSGGPELCDWLSIIICVDCSTSYKSILFIDFQFRFLNIESKNNTGNLGIPLAEIQLYMCIHLLITLFKKEIKLVFCYKFSPTILLIIYSHLHLGHYKF